MQSKYPYPTCLVLAFAVSVHLAGCTADAPSREPTDAVPIPPELVAAARSVLRPFSSGYTTILYINFDGAQITPGGNSALTNHSFIAKKQATIAPFRGDATDRAAIAEMVRGYFTPYNITVVTTRPTSGNYTMAVVGGRNQDIGNTDSYGGIAPLDCGNDFDSDLTFVFSEYVWDGYQFIPWAYNYKIALNIAHEAAHAFGLPHSDDCADVMSYKQCLLVEKTFLDKAMAMQSDSVGDCGMNSMNSHQLLIQNVGKVGEQPPATPTPTPGKDTEAPKVVITDPKSGATVGASLTLAAVATDNTAVTKVEALVDGKLNGTLTVSPFFFKVTLTTGQHSLTVRAYDAAGNKGSATVLVTLPAANPNPSPNPNPSSTTTTQGTLPFGATCTDGIECASNMCAVSSTGKYCTQACDPSAPNCPDSASCLETTTGDHVCGAPASLPVDSNPTDDNTTDGNGNSPSSTADGCSMSGQPGGSPLLPALALLLLVALVRRRERH